MYKTYLCIIYHSTTVIAKIKEMQQYVFYDIPRYMYFTVGYIYISLEMLD